MIRLIANGLVVLFVSSGTAAMLIDRPALAADDAVVQADRALVQALEKDDQAAANRLLDPDFTWIDTDGILWFKEDAFQAGLKPLVTSGDDVRVVEHKYGKVVWIQENQGNKYAAHFWVERPSGWRLLHTNEIETRPKEEEVGARPNFAIPCENPCKEVPFKMLTPNEQAAMAAWQEQESGVPEQWYRHVPDDNITITSYGPLTKQDRWTGIQKREQSHAPKVGVSPVLWGRLWDFDGSVVMIMCQPDWGRKAYWSSRVYAKNKDGLWQMMESYHTTIQASPILTGVPQK